MKEGMALNQVREIGKAENGKGHFGDIIEVLNQRTNTHTTLKKHLKSQSHPLKPVVMIGASGLTDGVHQELERALDDRELIKIRISHKDREYRNEITDQIVQEHDADLINKIGQIIVIYRKTRTE